ncbi:MAG: acyl-CoA synthetase [Alphaproteobacteria bacterium]|nr:acyl-CoA synthetase [Rhodospirillales bacterium]MCW9046145.1 acyl-CoA synthetase [Alphaproteobacteria bacterium]
MARAPKPPPTGKKKGLSWTGISIIILAIGLVIVAMPTVFLLIFGLLPTFASLVTDKTYQRSVTFCVGALNFSGLFPYLLDLWGGANTMAAAGGIITDVFALFIIYGAAAFGFMVFSSVPAMIGSFLTVVNERRMKVLRKTQQSLIKEWGEDVADTGLPGSETAKQEKAKDKAPPAPDATATPQGTKTNA